MPENDVVQLVQDQKEKVAVLAAVLFDELPVEQ